MVEYLPEGARPIPRQLGVLVTTWRSRALSFARESTLLIYSALIDNTLVVVLERLQLDKLLRKAQPWLESGSAKLFGKPSIVSTALIVRLPKGDAQIMLRVRRSARERLEINVIALH